MDLVFVVTLIFIPISFVISAFFSGSETVLTSCSNYTIENLKLRIPSRAKLLEFWQKNPNRVLTTVILGNTFAVVLCGVLAACLGEKISRVWDWPAHWTVAAVSLMIGFSIFLFSEVLPKILGRLYSERLAPWVILPLVPLTKIIHPVVLIFGKIAEVFVRILGRTPQKDVPILSLSDLKGMLGTDGGTETISSSRRILKNILEFGQLDVKDICKTRGKIFAVDIRKSPMEVLKTVLEAHYSRIPVYRESLDNIVGIIYAKDLLTAWRTDGLILIPDLLRPAYFVSEKTLVTELLREFKKGRRHFAVVQDEGKRTSGIVTIEDVLEEIVGEVYDEVKV